MFRIDHPSAAVTLPAVGAVGTPGYFTIGDPGSGAQATTVTADWANAVQEEIVGVVVGAGLTLDKANNGQLLAAINALITGVGTGSLLKAQNLNDLTDKAQARTNLGLGTAAVATVGLSAANVPNVAQADTRYAQLIGATFTGAVRAPQVGIGPRQGLVYETDVDGSVGVRAGVTSAERFWRFGADGVLYCLNGGASFNGAVFAASAVFSGDVAAATGNFSGQVAAQSGNFTGQVTATSFNATP